MMTTSTQLTLRIGAAAAAVLLVSVLALRASSAAFSDTTGNAGNSFAAGTVVLVDNDAGVAMFNATNLKPGDSAVGCIEVTYQGSLDAQVRMYGTVAGGDGLADYLDLTIERGVSGCTGFVSAVTVWDTASDGDLGVFLALPSNYANGVDTWGVTGGAPDDMIGYRLTITQQDDNAAQGKSATVDFTWEAQNT